MEIFDFLASREKYFKDYKSYARMLKETVKKS
jgi:hypothetical protein